jgi:hypothetical protein
MGSGNPEEGGAPTTARPLLAYHSQRLRRRTFTARRDHGNRAMRMSKDGTSSLLWATAEDAKCCCSPA